MLKSKTGSLAIALSSYPPFGSLEVVVGYTHFPQGTMLGRTSEVCANIHAQDLNKPRKAIGP